MTDVNMEDVKDLNVISFVKVLQIVIQIYFVKMENVHISKLQ